MARSTEAPAWARFPARGGQTVQPVPAPASTIEEASRSKKEGGRSQKLILFIRGNAISGAPIIRGTSQLPNPPIMIGITIKKIITNAWAVTITLQIWSSPRRAPGWPSSARMSRLRAVPTIPAQAPNSKQRVPMSLWFVEKSQRLMNIGKMAEQALGCKSKYRGLSPLFTKPCGGCYTLNCKFKEAASTLPGLLPPFFPTRREKQIEAS